MASDPSPNTPQVADQSQYEEATHEDRWVELDEGPGYFQVRELAPLKLLRDMRKYDVSDLLGGDDADRNAMAETVKDGSFEAFLENTVLPNIIQPNCYWDPDDDDADVIGDADADFDLAALEPQDLMKVITAMTGQDVDDLQDQMDDQFPGQPAGASGASNR